MHTGVFHFLMLTVIYNAHLRLGVSLIMRKRSLIIGNRSTDSNNGGWMVPPLNYSFIYWMDYAISLGILMSLASSLVSLADYKSFLLRQLLPQLLMGMTA